MKNFRIPAISLVAIALSGTALAQNPWTNLPTSFQTADGYVDDFESYAGSVPAHMGVHALDAISYVADPEAWCNIGQLAACLSASSGLSCLEMGLDPASSNYHDVLNGLVIGLDGTSAGADLWLDFQAIDHGDETDTWDGVWVSDDGTNWYQASGWSAAGSSAWAHVSDFNISNTGASTAGQFYLLFAQDDNFPYGYLDGIGVDDINVDTTPPPPPAILHTEVNPANGHTYHLLEVSKWSEAEAAAVLYGGHLASIADQAEHDWVAQTFGNWGGVQRSLWIGLTDEALEGTFVWTDGTPFSYTNWANGEPNNSTANDPNGEDYVFLYPGGGKWNDLHDTDTSVWFSNLCGVVEISGPTGPQMSVTGLVAGGSVTIAVTAATPANLVRHGYSMVGAGPVSTAFGDLLLSPPYTELPGILTDATGSGSFTAPVPPGTTGISVWFHGFDMGSLSFTNGVAAVIG